MKNDDYMFQIEKQKKILDYVNKTKKATVIELSEYLGVSKVTIRRYLNELENKGLIFKTHGGALSMDNDLNHEIPYESKVDLNSSQKEKIGAAAAKLIEEGDVIILDAGSTTLEIATHLENKNVTVITNDIKIAMELASRPNVKLIITGGTVHKHVYTVIGSETEAFINKIHVNKTFLGADAINMEFGITNRTLEEASVKKAMIKAGEQTILVADYSKFNKKAFADVCSLDGIDTLVIDKLDEDYQEAFNKKGIDVILA